MLNRLTDLLEVSLGCGVVILLLLALTPLLSMRFSPRLRYWAWALLAIRLLLPGIPWGRNTIPAPIQIETPHTITAPAYDGMAQDINAASPYGYTADVFGNTTYHVWYSDDQNNSIRAYDNPFFRLEAYNNDWSLSFHWEGIWIAGLLLCLGWQFGSYFSFCRRIKRLAIPASEEDWAALAAQQQLLGLQRKVNLVRNETISSPLLMGFIKPTIVLPAQLPEHTLTPSLAHELTHLKRGDLWYQLLLILARCVHWFNPLVWLMVRQAKRDMELCCDYDLLQSQGVEVRRSYGQAILDQMTAGQSTSSLTTGFSGDKKSIFTRFKAIMDTSPKKKGTAILVLILFAAALAGGLVVFQNDTKDEPAPTGDTLRVTLENDLYQSIAANYYQSGFDWDYDQLFCLTSFADSEEVLIQMPDGIDPADIRISEDRYRSDNRYIPDQKNIVERRTSERSVMGDSTLCLTVTRHHSGAEEHSIFFLTWGKNSEFRYVFRLDFTSPEKAVIVSLKNQPKDTLSAAYIDDSGQPVPPSRDLPTLNAAEGDSISIQWPSGFGETATLTRTHYAYNENREKVSQANYEPSSLSNHQRTFGTGISRHFEEYTEVVVFTLSLGTDDPSVYAFQVCFEPQSPTVTAYLDDREDEAITASYYPNGFQGGDLNALPTLYAAGDSVRLFVQLPNEINGPVYLGHTQYSGSGSLHSISGIDFQELSIASPEDNLRYGPNTQFSFSLLGLQTDFEHKVFFLTWGENSLFHYVFQVKAKPNPELTLTDAFELYPSGPFSVSATEQDAIPYYKFENTPAGISILMPEHCQTDPSIISYRGKPITTILPCNPLAGYLYGNAGGQASFTTVDLTGDGKDELLYLWGYGGTGVWEDQCKIFDLSTMEELPVSPVDEELLAKCVQAELLDYEDDYGGIFRITTADGTVTYGSTTAQDTAQAPGPVKLRFDGHTHLNLEENQLKLTVAFSPKSDGTFMHTMSYLGDLTGTLTYSPSLRAFTHSPPFTMELYSPIEYQP